MLIVRQAKFVETYMGRNGPAFENVGRLKISDRVRVMSRRCVVEF